MSTNNINDKVSCIEERFGKKILSVREVAEYLGVDEEMVDMLAGAGDIKTVGCNDKLFKVIDIVHFELGISNERGREMENSNAVTKVTRGSIYKTGSSKNPFEIAFKITFADGSARRVKARGASEEEALANKELKVQELIEEYENNNSVYPVVIEKGNREGKMVTFAEVADRWYAEFLLEQESKGNSLSNIEGAKYSLRAINKKIGDISIKEIDTKKGQEMIMAVSINEETGNWNSQSMVEKIARYFKKVMGYAFDNGYTDKRMGKIELNKNLTKPVKDDRFLTEEELQKVGEALKENERYYTLFMLIVSTGLRQEEAFALSIDDFRVEGEIHSVYVSKADVEVEKNRYAIVDRLKHNENAREVEIPKEVYDLIHAYYFGTLKDKEWVERRKACGTEGLIFVNQNGGVINKRTFYRSFRNYLERNMEGDTKVRLHMFRHSYASLMCDELSIEEVSTTLGHRNIAITNLYYRTKTQKQRERVSKASSNLLNRINGTSQS